MPTDKLCKTCNTRKPIEEFGLNSPARNGKRYRRCHCRPCHTKIRKGYATSPEATRRAEQKRLSKATAERAANERTEHYIRLDTRASDRKKGRKNDLTKEFIAEQIAKGCTYCGESQIRMTLDRIDNDRGHTMDNVVSACVRCNHVRGDMPYEAWVVVARAMRRVRKQGLFGDWRGRSKPWSTTQRTNNVTETETRK